MIVEEEIILSQIIEDAQKESTRIRQEAESLAKTEEVGATDRYAILLRPLPNALSDK